MLNPLSNLKAQIFRFCAVLSIAVSTSITVQAQVQIWGASQQGGSNGIGSLFNVYDNGTDFLIKSEFINSVEGNKPRSRVIIGSDGNYYGITSEGGTNNGGTIFRYGVNGFENLYNLNPAADGSNSRGDMLEISPGVFIGTTTNASTNNAGSIFRFSIADGFSTLHTFQPSTEGGNPSGALAYNASTQKLYGTCSSGGTDGFGTCFSYDLNGMFTVQHHFGGGAAGAYPQGGVILAEDGILYGTTQYGGNHSQGSIFKLNPQNDTHEILYHINSTTSDGRYPFGRLVESSPGVFMGTIDAHLLAIDATSGELIWDAQMAELSAVPVGQLTHSYSDWSQRLHPDDQDRAQAQARRCQRGRASSRASTSCPCSDSPYPTV